MLHIPCSSLIPLGQKESNGCNIYQDHTQILVDKTKGTLGGIRFSVYVKIGRPWRQWQGRKIKWGAEAIKRTKGQQAKKRDWLWEGFKAEKAKEWAYTLPKGQTSVLLWLPFKLPWLLGFQNQWVLLELFHEGSFELFSILFLFISSFPSRWIFVHGL